MTTLKTSLDPNARTEATKQVERILVNQDPYVFFARYRWFLISVPKVQGSGSITYSLPIRVSRVSVSGSFQYVGSRYTQIDDLTPGIGTVNIASFPGTIGGPLTQNTFTFNPLLPAYSLFNIRVGLARSSWDAAVFINNVTDERAFLALDRERGLRARVGYLTNQPRTLGVSLRFNY